MSQPLPPPPPSSVDNQFILTYDHIESFYTHYFGLNFNKSIFCFHPKCATFYSSNDFKYHFHHLFDLFSHPFNTHLAFFDSIENLPTTPTSTPTSTSTNLSIQTVFPALTFLDEILTIFQNPAFTPTSFCGQRFYFQSNFIKNPTHAMATMTNPAIDHSTDDMSLVFPPSNLNIEQYTQHFLNLIGNPTAFASHLRHTVLLRESFQLRVGENLTFDCTTLLNPLIALCLVHFHIICEYYNIVQCGSLDFALLIKQMTLRPSSFSSTPLSQYNDDEIHFLTTILPNAFKSSPMYPGKLNKGIIFPLSINPSTSASFTQHYSKLISPMISLELSSSLPSKPHKVPTTNIPFSIFAYLAILNTIMSEAWLVIFQNYSKKTNNRTYIPLFLHIPSLPSDLDCALIPTARLTFTSVPNTPLSFSWEKTLQMLHFKLCQYVRFPIRQNDPLSSLKSYNSPLIINKIVNTLEFSVFGKNNQGISPYLYLSTVLFGLQLAHIAIIMTWAEQFNIFSAKDNQQSSKDSLEMNADTSSFRLQYQHSYCLNTDTSPTILPHNTSSTNPIMSAILTNSSKLQYVTDSMNFLSILGLLTQILNSLHSNTNTTIHISTILSHFHPSLLFMILSIIIRSKYDHPSHGKFFLALGKCLVYDLNSQLDFSIRSILNLYFEHKYMDRPSNHHLEDGMLVTLANQTNQTLSNNIMLSTNTLPRINHTLASVYYGQSIYQQNYDLKSQLQTTTLQSEFTQFFNHHANVSLSPSDYTKKVAQMIQCNHGLAVYRKQPPNVPATYPSSLLYLKWLFPDRNPAPHFTKHSETTPPPKVKLGGQLLDKLWCSFFHFFRDTSISLLSNTLHYINLTQDLLSSIQTVPPLSFQRQSSPLSHQPNKHDDITINSFSHPSTLLGIDPQLYCIPFMAIQHNFSRTLFHLISSTDWNKPCKSNMKRNRSRFLDCEYVLPTLLYLNFFHTFLCKPIAILTIEKEINPNTATSTQSSVPIILFQKLTSLTKNDTSSYNNVDSTLDALNLWDCGLPSSPSTPITPFIGQHSPHTLFNNTQTLSDPSLLIDSSVHLDIQNPSSQFTLQQYCQTPHYKANLFKHTHLPPSVIKQLYCIYTEALIFTIQGFSYATFASSSMNDPITSPLWTADVGISTLSAPGCPFKWDDDFTLLCNTPLKTTLQWDQLTDFSGTIQQATELFCFDENNKSHPEIVQYDSYHQHILDLHTNPQQVRYSFNPQHFNKSFFQRGARTTVPDYILDQQRTGMIAIAYEWSSAMVQHSIELFIELLLNENSYEFISQIDFSDLAEEYVIDYIPPDPVDWGSKDKWTTNLPSNCTDEDTFPLYKQLVPTQYQAQIPTLATASICPQGHDYLPHSIYNPKNSSQEQKDALANHYDENQFSAPAFVFPDKWNNNRDQLQSLGFKTPTRGHLPFFYNLTSDEQDELYQTFSFANLTSPSTSSTISHSTASNKPLVLDVDLAEYLHQVNNEIPMHFQKAMLQSSQENCLSSNSAITSTNHQEYLCNQPQYLVDHYSETFFESNQSIKSNNLLTNPKNSTTITPSQIEHPILHLPSSTITSKDILDVFTTLSINDEYITPNTKHLYSSLPPSITAPKLLPTTFTIPSSLLFDQIYTQAVKHK